MRDLFKVPEIPQLPTLELERFESRHRDMESAAVQISSAIEEAMNRAMLGHTASMVDTLRDRATLAGEAAEKILTASGAFESNRVAMEQAAGLVSPTLSAIADLQPQLDPLDIQRSTELAFGLVDQYRKASATVSTVVDSLLREQQTLGSHLGASALRPFLAVSQAAIEELGRRSAGAALPESFVGDLFHRLGKLEAREDEDDLSEGLDEVVEWFSEEAKRHPISASTFWALLSILFTIILALHSYVSALHSEERILQRIAESRQQEVQRTQILIAESEARMLHALERHAKAAEGAKLLVVTKRLHLRSGPSSKTESLRLLNPNTQLELTGDEGNWLSVRFFDFEAGQLREGWVYRRFVREVVIRPEQGRSSVLGSPTGDCPEESQTSETTAYSAESERPFRVMVNGRWVGA